MFPLSFLELGVYQDAPCVDNTHYARKIIETLGLNPGSDIENSLCFSRNSDMLDAAYAMITCSTICSIL
jgi:hypothetical protein